MGNWGRWALMAALAWGAAFAAPEVKTFSSRCGAESGLEGTGLLFQWQQKVFLLSSQARFFHGNKGFCHRVLVAGQAHPAVLQAADWGYGLALLRVPELAVSAEVPSLSELLPAVLQPGTAIHFQGFRFREQGLSDRAEGYVLTPASPRHSIALVAEVAELQGASAEGGMIGAPVFTAEGKWAGVLAHQYLKLVPGTSTRPLDWDETPGHVENQLLLLPAVTVRDWVQRALDGQLRLPFYWDPQDRLANRARIRSGSIVWESRCPTPSWPAGGADGAGVGGEAELSPYCSAVAVKIDGAAPWPFTHSETWSKEVRKIVQESGEYPVRFLLRRSFGRLTRVPFWSLGDFFRGLREEGWAPVAVGVPGNPAQPWPALREKSLAVFAPIEKLFARENPPEIHGLLREVYLRLQILSSPQASWVVSGDLRPLIDPHGSFQYEWAVLGDQAPDLTKSVRDDLRAILRLLEK